MDGRPPIATSVRCTDHWRLATPWDWRPASAGRSPKIGPHETLGDHYRRSSFVAGTLAFVLLDLSAAIPPRKTFFSSDPCLAFAPGPFDAILVGDMFYERALRLVNAAA
jgi:hypothetical protein